NAGKLCEEFIAPRAEEVDELGATLKDGVVSWAPGTQENMKVLAQAGLMGGILPRRYGGLNMPVTVNNLVVEMVSQADASLMNLFGLQDIAVTLYKFGNEEQKNRVLPKFASGEVSGSMALTEPDAGSDLQAVTLKAIEKDGKWYLDGVKRFITNGSGEVSLVLARSEEGSKTGRGLSMLLYERDRDKNMVVRRIENKLGIHGSPTCELQFNMAEAELVGKRRFGLIKYVMDLMNGARLAVSAQALGIAQASYNEARKYATEREQFGKKIIEMPAVFQMLLHMKAEIETSRILLYHTGLSVDYQEMYEHQLEAGKPVKKELKAAKVRAAFLTPLAKFVTTEMANKAAYDALQIHGGVGYMKDFTVQRLYRDARITNIYEGTTQLQVVASIGAITSGWFFTEMESLAISTLSRLSEEGRQFAKWVEDFKTLASKVKEVESTQFHAFVAGYLVETAAILYRLFLFLPVVEKHEEKQAVFDFFFNDSAVNIANLRNRVETLIAKNSSNFSAITSFIDEDE
ncbi:acyl-CoA dehydrogenase family protein, partial [bacterium]|nr:acyl-CoA dehydrogenase family protein [bacterium]